MEVMKQKIAGFHRGHNSERSWLTDSLSTHEINIISLSVSYFLVNESLNTGNK